MKETISREEIRSLEEKIARTRIQRARTVQLPQIVDQAELKRWRQSIKKGFTVQTPAEVKLFINTMAFILPDFARYSQESQLISGRDLQLCGHDQWEGEKIDPWTMYELIVPKLQAVDHHVAMCKMYHRKGRQGLIDYCKARVIPSELRKVLKTMDEEVFNLRSPEFTRKMEEIRAIKKDESIL